MVEVRGGGRPDDERRVEGDLLEEAERPLAQHLVAPDHQGAADPETQVQPGDIVAHQVDAAGVRHSQSPLVAHPQVRDGERIEPHDARRHGVDGHRVGAGQDDVADHRVHGARAGAVAAHRAVHDGENAGVQLLLHHDEVDQHLVHVLVRVVPHFLEETPEGVLDRSGGRGVAVRLDGRQVNDAPAGVDGRDLDALGEDGVQLQERRLETMDLPIDLWKRREGEAVTLQDRQPAVVGGPLPWVGDHGPVLDRVQAGGSVPVLQHRLDHPFDLPRLAGAGGKVFRPGQVQLDEGVAGGIHAVLVAGQPHEATVIVDHPAGVRPQGGDAGSGHAASSPVAPDGSSGEWELYVARVPRATPGGRKRAARAPFPRPDRSP